MTIDASLNFPLGAVRRDASTLRMNRFIKYRDLSWVLKVLVDALIPIKTSYNQLAKPVEKLALH